MAFVPRRGCTYHPVSGGARSRESRLPAPDQVSHRRDRLWYRLLGVGGMGVSEVLLWVIRWYVIAGLVLNKCTSRAQQFS